MRKNNRLLDLIEQLKEEYAINGRTYNRLKKAILEGDRDSWGSYGQ